ncbi:MAG: hypothetical protein FWG66_08345 [Spirochaetes bacterium]|nr:hypothetical protein [Spirochaetota bacterium]
MIIEQTIEIPASRQIILEVPPEIPVGTTAQVKLVCADPFTTAGANGRTPISQYFGIISPDTYGDGMAYQRKLRDEWDD